MKRIFTPGCALILYKNHLAEKLLSYLARGHGVTERLFVCCRHTPRAAAGNLVFNVCPGCDRRYRQNYPGGRTLSLWEVLAESDDFPLPNYHGTRMTVSDACPARHRPGIHDAVRKLAARMNIEVIEPLETREKSVCCGDSYVGGMPPEEVLRRMKDRVASLPMEEVIVYCVSCIKALRNGGAKPRYLVDLLFAEETLPGITDPISWHEELAGFVAAHKEES